MTSPPRHVAILAGGGDLPLQIAASVSARGGAVHIVAIRGEADASVEAYPHTWVNIAGARRMFSALQPPAGADGVMVIAGAVTRPDLLKLRPDFGIIRVLVQVLGLITAGGDDALLTRAIRIFEREGLTVVGVQDVTPELLIGEGVLSAARPDAAAHADITRGQAVLAALGGLDVGQAIVVEDGKVLAIEGVEGTDRMLARLAEGRQANGRAVLLKAPKPRQERRVDLPTIGAKTVARAREAGIRGIAVVAGEAIGLQRSKMVATADAHGMFIAGVPTVPTTDIAAHRGAIRSTRGHTPRPGDIADMQKAFDAVHRLAPYDTGAAAAVVRGHVIAVSAAEGPHGLLQRASSLSQWGLRRFAGRRGAVAVRLDAKFTLADAESLLPNIARAGFAALALVQTDAPPANLERLAATAKQHRLSVVAMA